ncbi:hypothetical protein [Nocardia sp. XZ_19_369]|uniref:hypothetical protein n=1 Tax=Nocardia sp. XZ_19_369 TaxID=2769487 RepID=UPI00188E40AD|nr:hypothetical protein [Nocardia sp. XZ_19_369]
MTESHPAAPAAAVPSTIWACGADVLDPNDLWPEVVLRRAITEFSRPAAPVRLLAATKSHQLAARRAHTQLADTGREIRTGTLSDSPAARGEADLIIASLLPDPTHPHSADTYTRLAFTAADQLRGGAVLAVLTRTGLTPTDTLDDATGPVVAAAQTADLLYLSHIVATPIRDDTIPTPAHRSGQNNHRHHVVHIDLTVFIRPDDQNLAAAVDHAA